ncbi:LysE family translocator [Desulfomicrobium baculatum]|uniref:Lysine exporter protein (LYSE/YGGA) n=1 Tax=Desulfomicrobium baculatum (strain DSM 4028 / VKM B-1378 / X) TaxID=525897 RepID=C7LTD3_DESBD|nr:LysE family translocator [Desulfomicrobium baculatum]ACU89490.1 Lysine exporter protein (LYSE/YGGA) [Desulfomicrobium baculatum DSM 4028]
MSPDTYLAFLLATIVVLVIPGPTIMLVVSCSLTQGKRLALPLALGVGLGDTVAMIASMAGLGALLATSATLFTVLKWVGAFYLVYLGVKTFRTNPVSGKDLPRVASVSRGASVFRAFAVTATNPKSIAFFCAFMPQFINHAEPVMAQVLILGSTFVILAVVNATLYALLAARARYAVTNPRIMKMVNWAGGSALIGAGVLTAAIRRT